MLAGYACDFYPDNRLRARGVFDLFEGIPAYDPRPQPKTINDVPPLRVRQVRAIWHWFAVNRRKLRWSETRKAYYIAH